MKRNLYLLKDKKAIWVFAIGLLSTFLLHPSHLRSQSEDVRKRYLANPNQLTPAEQLHRLRQQKDEEYMVRKSGGVITERQKMQLLAKESGLSFPLENVRCASDEYNKFLRERYPTSGAQEFEEWMRQKLFEVGGLSRNRVIPVVVHILHNGQAEGVGPNISEAQILSQIKVLNEDFNRVAGTRGADRTSLGGYGDRAADMEVEFRLATIDPLGRPTNGIDRINGGKDAYDLADFELGLKQATIWNPDFYFNIWVGDNLTTNGLSGLLGYAQFPGSSGLEGLNDDEGPADTDGIVVHTQAFGSIDAAAGGDFYLGDWPYVFGRTATHETGHFLGLHHLWGDGSCESDDFVDDTPPQSGYARTCGQGVSRISCGSVDMTENYMSYTPDACLNLFSAGQKKRIDVVLEFSPRRASLLESQAHSGVKPSALFAAGSRFSVDAENLSVNDMCVGAIGVVCNEVIQGSLLDATNVGTPDFCGITPQAPGEWYALTGTGRETTISTISSNTNFDTKLNVYTGGCEALACVDGNDDSPNAPSGTFQSELTFMAESGVNYYIYVSGFDGVSGNFELAITCEDLPPAPLNDEPENAILIDCNSNTQGTNTGATQSMESTWTDFLPNNDVWYVLNTPGISQKATVSTCNAADYDTRLEIFDASFNLVASNDDNLDCPNFTSELIAFLNPDATYYISAGGWSGEEGTFELSVSCQDFNMQEGGQTCATAIPLICNAIVTGSTLDALDPIQSGAPNNLPPDMIPQAPGKWYTLTLDEDAFVRLNTCNAGTDYDSDIEVYTGGPCAEGGPNLSLLASNDSSTEGCAEGDPFGADLFFEAQAGVEYKIFINGYVSQVSGASQGNFELSVECFPKTCEALDIVEGAAAYADPTCELLGGPNSITAVFTIFTSPYAYLLTDQADWRIEINGIEYLFDLLELNVDNIVIGVPEFYSGPEVEVAFFLSEECEISKEDVFDPPQECTTYILGDFVWEDLDGDGVQDVDEPGVGGVKVSLFDGAGDLEFFTVTTNADGAYFIYSTAGDHHLEFENAPTYYYSPKDRTSDNLDSDVYYDPFTGKGVTEVFDVFDDNDDIDAGLTACPPLDQVGCNDNIHVTLDGECEALITPDMILEGDYLCFKDLLVNVVAPGEVNLGNRVSSNYFGLQLAATVADPQTGYHCWGYITLEDKGAPVLECPRTVDRAAVYIQSNLLQGNLSRGDQTFPPANYSCWTTANTVIGSTDSPHYYNEIRFSIKEEGVYTFYMYSPDFDATGAIFREDFDPGRPCENIIALGESVFTPISPADEFLTGVPSWDVVAGSDPALRLAAPLRENEEYVIVTTSAQPLAEGAFGWFVFRDGGLDSEGNILYIPNETNTVEDDEPRQIYDGYVFFDLLYSDLETILLTGEQCYYTDGEGNLLSNIDFDDDGALEYTSNDLIEKLQTTGLVYNGNFNQGGAVHDNCDFLKICVSDEVVRGEGDCVQDYIRRSFYAVDKSGNRSETCYQIINFRRPVYADVIFPQLVSPVECDAGFPEDAEGLPDPKLTGFPFIRSAFGHHDLDEVYYNLGADYTNKVIVESCENTYSLIREWSIFDWCQIPGQDELNNSALVKWPQLIKVGDFTAPEIKDPGDKQYLSTVAFGCAGRMIVPGVEYSDNCSENVSIHAMLYKQNIIEVVDRYGLLTGEQEIEYEEIGEVEVNELVNGIEKDHIYKIVYTAADDCGNVSEAVDLLLEVRDDVAPVATCEDDLYVSIGGDGLAKVTAEDVDGGSKDNCELKALYVSRELTTEDLLEAYLDQVYELTFDDLVRSGLRDLDNDAESEIWVVDKNKDDLWTSDEDFRILRLKDNSWFTSWGICIYALCNDVNADIRVELLAIDASNNTNVCVMDLVIEDKITPFCRAPENIELNCADLPLGFDPEDADQLSSIFGDATGADNCLSVITRQISSEADWLCNAGTIVRRFVAEDSKGLVSLNACTQTIVVHPVHNYEIKFPKDLDAECHMLELNTLETKEIACDLLSINIIENRFEASGEACYSLERTFRVVNWCEYDGRSPAVVIPRDVDCDGRGGEEDVYVLRRPDITYVDKDNDENNNLINNSLCRNGAEGHYDNSLLNETLQSTGFWEYTQFVRVIDNTAPEISINGPDVFCSLDGVDCEGEINFLIEIEEEICFGEDVLMEAFIDGEAVAITGTYPGFTVGGRYEVGEHELEIYVLDGCRNSESVVKSFQVVDCKAPTPICINGLAIELMPTEAGTDVDGDGDEDPGAMTIWAADFKVGDLEDCSEGITLSINRVGETPDKTRDRLILTCDDPETLAVEIYAWDSADNPTAVQPDGTIGGSNYDYCLTYIQVQDNMFNLCGGGLAPIAVAGLITNENNETVENVQINLSGDMSADAMTSISGGFNFGDLIPGNDYTLKPVKDDDYLNGVSTFDLVLTTKHILGSRKLDSPYKMIAADANNSGSITALDLIYMRKLILSVNSSLPNNTSWRFVPASYQFPDPANPWFESFPEILNYNDLQTAVASGDFIAIKVADVNGNAAANSLMASRRETSGVFKLKIEDRELVAGGEYRASFRADDLSIQGYQFTLNHEGLELIDMEYGEAGAENFGIIADEVITASWNGEAKTNEMFTMVFRAKVDGRLSELLRLNSRYTQAEAYGANSELLDVALNFEEQDGRNLKDSFHLYQNAPNPFTDETVIGFNLPQAAEAKITIQDVRGKILKVIQGEYLKGYNQIRINGNELSGSIAFGSLLYYTLKTGDFTATKKMILMSE